MYKQQKLDSSACKQSWRVAGTLGNRGGKHACTLRFCNCGSAETHSLNSKSQVKETLVNL